MDDFCLLTLNLFTGSSTRFPRGLGKVKFPFRRADVQPFCHLSDGKMLHVATLLSKGVWRPWQGVIRPGKERQANWGLHRVQVLRDWEAWTWAAARPLESCNSSQKMSCICGWKQKWFHPGPDATGSSQDKNQSKIQVCPWNQCPMVNCTYDTCCFICLWFSEKVFRENEHALLRTMMMIVHRRAAVTTSCMYQYT